MKTDQERDPLDAIVNKLWNMTSEEINDWIEEQKKDPNYKKVEGIFRALDAFNKHIFAEFQEKFIQKRKQIRKKRTQLRKEFIKHRIKKYDRRNTESSN